MGEHTKGLLRVSGTGHICSGDTVIPYDDLKADARRLVACWNALQAASTEDLETAVRLGITDVSRGNMLSSRLKLQKQRDALLEALESGLDLVAQIKYQFGRLPIPAEIDSFEEKARAAIAAVESDKGE